MRYSIRHTEMGMSSRARVFTVALALFALLLLTVEPALPHQHGGGSSPNCPVCQAAHSVPAQAVAAANCEESEHARHKV